VGRRSDSFDESNLKKRGDGKLGGGGRFQGVFREGKISGPIMDAVGDSIGKSKGQKNKKGKQEKKGGVRPCQVRENRVPITISFEETLRA